MRILNVMMSRELGGIQQVFIDYYHMLCKGGFEVMNMCESRALIREELDAQNIPYLHTTNYSQYDFFSLARIQKMVEEYKPDIVIAHANRPIFVFSRIKNRSFILVGVVHNYYIQNVKRCDAVICVSNHIQKDVASKSETPAYYVPNAMKFDRDNQGQIISKLVQKLTLDKSKKGKEETLIIGSMGRFVEKKGFEKLLKAVRLLKDQNYNIKLYMAGDGPYRDYTVKSYKKYGVDDIVTYRGWVEDKYAFLDELDVFCMPSREEPFGIVLIEAMRACLLIVASDAGGPTEILGKDGDISLIFPKDDHKILAEKFVEFINMPEELKKDMISRAYHRLVEEYDQERVAEKLAQTVKEIQKKIKKVA